MTAPLISILMPSYNHDQFIGAAIRSVLAQTLADFELIIVDDGSRDASPQIIAGQCDPRIRSRLLDRNQGACNAMNVALQMSRGQFIAVCNSDDVWHSEKLSRQMDVINSLPRVAAVFSDVTWIGDDGSELSDLPPFATIFQRQNRSRWRWLRRLLEDENCLCHPSVLIRRIAYDVAGFYDNRFRQIPDMDQWIRVLEHFDIFVMPDKLVSFRIHAHNTSAPTPEVSRRDWNEHRIILRRAFDRMSKENFERAFGFRFPDIDDELDLRIEQGLYLLSYQGKYAGIFRELGLGILFEVSAVADGRARLSKKFGFDMTDFHREMGAQAYGSLEPAMPQRAVLRGLLHDKQYSIQYGGQNESLLSSTGEVHHVRHDEQQSFVDEIRIVAETIQFLGWAFDPGGQQPAQAIVVFLGDQFIGYGVSNELRPDVARHFDAPSALYAGFCLEFQQSEVIGELKRPRLFMLSGDGQAAELRGALEPIAIDTNKLLANTQPLNFILSGDWYGREAWGIWSAGTNAAIIYDASSLPDDYTIEIEAIVFPPGPVPIQEIQISDGDGNRLATMTNERPSGNVVVTVKRPRSRSGPFAALNFDIDNPTSPQDLGKGMDTRRLGIGLISLTFRACIDPTKSTLEAATSLPNAELGRA